MEELAKKTETAEKKGDLLLFVKIQTALVAVLVLLLVVGGIFAAVQVNKAMRVVDGLDMDKINAAVQSLSNIAAEMESWIWKGWARPWRPCGARPRSWPRPTSTPSTTASKP